MDFGTEWVHGKKMEEELPRSEGTCTTSPAAPSLSQVVRSGSHSNFVLPDASGGFICCFVSLFRVFSHRWGWEPSTLGFVPLRVFCLVLPLCLLKVRISVWLTRILVLPDTSSTGCARSPQEDPGTQTTHPALARPLAIPCRQQPGNPLPPEGQAPSGALLTLFSLRQIAHHSPRASPPPQAILV